MKVKELIRQLQQYDSNFDVVCWTEDSSLLPPGHLFRVLEIENVTEVEGQKVKGPDNVPSLKLERGLPKHAVINVTSDF